MKSRPPSSQNPPDGIKVTSDDGSHSGSSWTRDNGDKWDAPLLIGRTYTDPASLVSVTPVARGGTAPDEYIDVFVHLATA